MLCQTAHVLIDAPAASAFHYLSTLEHLPDWAVPFCQELELREDRWWVTTPDAVLAFEMASDPETRAVDLRFGPSHDRLVTYPLRVIASGRERCIVTFTAWQLPGMSRDDFPGIVEGLGAELGLLKARVEAKA